ncbi:MAG TPA: hypothetical protein VHZ28_09260 [Terracidiphilus sp.]|jgi:DNA-directed RNA polymerase sigma subunit (sigma70/sigma32)|nr:hypothetical protein [Terracidiphilus sp.]HEX4285272.1 hypothetical protein [Terracidiphilus sp.]
MKENRGIPQRGGAMAFDQIAEELGISRAAAQHIFASALRKLRRNRPDTLHRMRGLASQLDKERNSRRAA